MSLNETQWFTEIYDDLTAFSVRMESVLFEQQSEFQRVKIVETRGMGKVLILDGCFMVTEKDTFVYHEMISHPAMALIENPKKALVIGGGDGGVVTELVKYPQLESITLCEIDPLVVSSCREYFPEISSGLNDERVRVVNADGAKYVDQFANEFDLVLVDSTDPVGPGEVLFSTPFYTSIAKSLAKGGAAVFQTESPLFMEKNFRMAVGNLAEVFGPSHTWPYVATIPSYPGGLWSFTFCSKTLNPVHDARLRPLPSCLTGRLKYFTPEIGKAAFALPLFVSQMIG
jgi:spermidine synthase